MGDRVRWRLGYLLAQQLLAAGEQVVDIPAEKNDPIDARSVAIAALRVDSQRHPQTDQPNPRG